MFKAGDKVVVVRGPRVIDEDYRDRFIGHVGVVEAVYEDDGGYFVVRFGPDVPGAYTTGFRADEIEPAEGVV